MFNILKSITLKWWQIGVLKVTAVSFGILVGVYWAGFFSDWLIALLIIFLVGWFYLAGVWWKNWKE